MLNSKLMGGARRALPLVLLLVCWVAAPASATTIGYWKFDDGPLGSTASTLASEVNSPQFDGLAASNSGGPKPTFAAGHVRSSPANQALRFVNTGLPGDLNSHSGGRVSIPGSDPLMQPRDFTIEGFFKVDRHVNFATLFGKSRADAGGGSFILDTGGDGNLRARIDSQPLGGTGGGFNQNIGSGSAGFLEDGQWHHVAATYNDSNRQFTLFLDYVQVGQATTTNAIVYDSSPLLIGQGSGGRAFDGWVDDVRFSNVVLTPDQFLHVVPEPSTVLLLGGAGALLIAAARRKRRRVASLK